MYAKAIEAKLRGYFQGIRGLVAAYLFGSYAKQKNSGSSDIDIGILFRHGYIPDGMKQIEMREELASLIRKEIDLVIMNRANPILKHQVFKYGRCLLAKNRPLLTDFQVRSLIEYDDIKRVRRPVENALIEGKHG